MVRRSLIAGSVLIIAVLAGCAPPFGADSAGSNATVSLRLQFLGGESQSSARAISSPVIAQNIEIRIGAADIEPITSEVSRDSTELASSQLEFEVPPGEARTIEAIARNVKGVELYRGSTTIDIAAGSNQLIPLDLTKIPAPEGVSFQFRVSDNPGAGLAEDRPAVLGDDGQTAIVRVPEGVDLTSLVASFSVDDPEATVKVGDTVQISGQTANDFTDPVVYTVIGSEGGVRQYTIEVEASLVVSDSLFDVSVGYLELPYYGADPESGYASEIIAASEDINSESAEPVDVVVFGILDSSDSAAIDPGTYVLNTAGTEELYFIIMYDDIGISGAGTARSVASINTETFLNQNVSGLTSYENYYQIVDGSVTVAVTDGVYDVSWSLSTASGETLTGSFSRTPDRSGSVDSEIVNVSFDSVTVQSQEIDPNRRDYRVTVPFNTDLTSLTPTFTVSQGASVVSVRSTSSTAPVGTSLNEVNTNHVDGSSTYSFAGTVEVDVEAEIGYIGTNRVHVYYGDTDASGNPGIYIQNFINPGSATDGEIVRIDDFTAGTGSFTTRIFTGLANERIPDIDYTGDGWTIFADSNNGGIGQFGNYVAPWSSLDSSFAVTLDFIAADRIRGFVYGTDPASAILHRVYFDGVTAAQTLDVGTLTPPTGLTFDGTITLHGVAVGPDGYAFVVMNQSGGTAPGVYLLKIDFDAASVVGWANLSTTTDFYSTNASAYAPYNDLLYREGSLYLLNRVYDGADTSKPAILEFDPENLGSGVIDSFGQYSTGGASGEFVNPRRFAAVLNRRFVILDESDDEAVDQITYFDDYDSFNGITGWGTYGASGISDDEFKFFIGS